MLLIHRPALSLALFWSGCVCSLQPLPGRRTVRTSWGERDPVPFVDARQSVAYLGLRTEDEWKSWYRQNSYSGFNKRLRYLRQYMPERPEAVYTEWEGWENWLSVPLGYEDAVEVAQNLGISSQELWWAYAREHADELLLLRLPARPHRFYRQQWNGYTEWLGLPDVPLTFPTQYNNCTHEECDPE